MRKEDREVTLSLRVERPTWHKIKRFILSHSNDSLDIFEIVQTNIEFI